MPTTKSNILPTTRLKPSKADRLRKQKEKDELEQELYNQFGFDGVTNKTRFKLESMKENYKEQKETNGGATSI